jgi:myo-inositol-1(or 4)-monophosphatase
VSADERVGTGARLQLAAELAVRGGRMALEPFHHAHARAEPGDLARDVQATIRDRLGAEIATAFPHDAVVGATMTMASGARSPSVYAWVVGPIEGVDDLRRGLPGFAITLGVLRNGMPFVGAVYDPVTRWLFSAWSGRGAWLNDRPLRAAPASLSGASLVAVGHPGAPGAPPFTEEWSRRYRLRCTGSTALHLCYVAMGALDLVHDHRTSLRDVTGAAAVVLEAGGVVTLDDGGPVFPATAAHLAGLPLSILAGNRVSHGEALVDIALAGSLR